MIKERNKSVLGTGNKRKTVEGKDRTTKKEIVMHTNFISSSSWIFRNTYGNSCISGVHKQSSKSNTINAGRILAGVVVVCLDGCCCCGGGLLFSQLSLRLLQLMIVSRRRTTSRRCGEDCSRTKEAIAKCCGNMQLH